MTNMYYSQPLRSNWWGFISKRVMFAVVAFFVISILLFVFTQMFFINDPLRGWETFPPVPTHEVREALGLNSPLMSQFFHWMGGFFTGDLGFSLDQFE
jgi:ABC-type dipeptide/oligopeptide/nickel transport system permease component